MILKPLRKISLLSSFLLAGMVFYACNKDTTQPVPILKKATVDIEVFHHYWNIPNINVYLKKNVTEFPGKDTTLYDMHKATDQDGNVQFKDVSYGNYYILVKGWDPVFFAQVVGYKPLVVNDSSAAGGIVDDRVFVSE